jgi:hypothetical protein
LDFNGVVLPVVVSDSLGDLIKEELLLSGVLSPSLKDHVGSTEHLYHSVEWKLRNDVEWSIDIEAKFFIKTLGLSLCLLVKIEYLPSLVSTVMSVVYSNSLTFFVCVTYNINTSLGLLDITEVLSLEGKDLPPSRVSAPDLHVVGLT